MRNNVAMLIIDMQNGFLREIKDQAAVGDCSEVINYVAKMVREANQPVVFIKDVEEADQLDEHELDFISEIPREEQDIVVEKTHSNGFWKTDLEAKLRELGVEFLILAGQAVEHCVLFTYNGARERGFRPVMLQGGVLSADPENVRNAIANRNFISWVAVQELLR